MMLSKESFVKGEVYLSYFDAINRKLMARFFPLENSNCGVLRIYDFNSLRCVSKISTKIAHAEYFYDTHCMHLHPPVESVLCSTDTAPDEVELKLCF